MKKNCIKCGPKDISCFNKKTSSKDGLQSTCKDCHRKQRSSYYRKNKSSIQRRVNKNNARYKKRNTQYIWDFLKEHPCVDCGETDPIVLEFDHLDDKKYNVSSMASHYLSLESIQKEIEKCEVRCANCHRRKTAKDQNWYSDVEK